MTEQQRRLATDVTQHDVRDPATSETLVSGSRSSAPAVGSATGAAGEPSRGDSVGRFVVLGVLGAGGMGHVYSAYDPHLDRKVAIKLLNADAARSEVLDARTRLLREAQAMAKINHPNVIKVHEVGMFGDQVYVAMEFADAGTIRAWLKARRRTLREILDVFVQAGRGLVAAHAVGLVHRDFKPDNVLMASDGNVRVTDFGLVSVLAEQPESTTVPDRPPAGVVELSRSGSTPLSQDLTRTGSIMGTPTYMAPEQFRGVGSTARTDQFAFCVALYEALYDERPFAGATYQELAANVLGGKLAPTPRGARVPSWLRRILLRGLAVDAAARYPSMVELLSALERDPQRRRRKLMWLGGGTACVAAATLAFAFRSSAGAECGAGRDHVARVWNPELRARMKAAFAASGRPLAAPSFERATEMLDGWTRSWELGYVGACEDTRVRGEQSEHLLDLRMQCLARRLDDARATIELVAAGGGAVDHALDALVALPSVAPCADPAVLLAAVPPPEQAVVRVQVMAVRAQLDQARGERRLGRYADGLVVARAAVVAARVASYPPVTAEAMLVVGELQHELGDGTAAETLRETMHVAAAAGDTPTTLDAAAWLIQVLTTHTSQYDRAQEVAGLAEAIASHARPPVDIFVRLEDTIALLEATRGKASDAQARYEKTLALAEKELGPDHPGTLTTLNQLATVLRDRGRYEDARKAYERVLASRERVLGKDHPGIAAVLGNVGGVYRREGKFDDAKRVYDRALAINRAALGPDHPEVANSLNNLGTFYGEKGDYETALHYHEQALAIFEKVYGPNNLAIVTAVSNVGSALSDLGRYDQAKVQIERALAISEAAQGHDNPHEADFLNNLAVVAQQQDHLDEALALLHRAQGIAEAANGPESPDVVDILLNEASVLTHQHKIKEAVALSTRTLPIAEKAYGATHPRVGMLLVNLGDQQANLGDNADALASFQRGLAILEAKYGKENSFVSYALIGIGSTLADLKRPAEAIPYLERAVAIRTKAGMAAQLLGEAEADLAEALGALPGPRARAIAEARAALVQFEKAGDAADAAVVRKWLAAHR